VVDRQLGYAVFSDDTGALGVLPLPCGFTVSSYQATTNKIDAGIPYKMLLNVLGAGRSVVEQAGYAMAPNVTAARF